jgi:hypothetical protein
MPSGIIYLIQPAEYVGTSIFKVGCSEKNDLSALFSYRSGSRHLVVLGSDNPRCVKSLITTRFNAEFNLYRGADYFEGPEDQMVCLFYEIWQQRRAIIKPAINN